MTELEEWLKEIAIQLQIRNKIEVKDWDYYNHCLESALKELKLAADVAPVKHGKWESTGTISCKCSKCQHSELKTRADEYSYCPRCGAKMDL